MRGPATGQGNEDAQDIPPCGAHGFAALAQTASIVEGGFEAML